MAGRQYFEDELAEEATWSSNHPHHVCFTGSQKGCFTPTPLKSAAIVGKDCSLLPKQKKARESLLTNTVCPPGYDMQMAAQEFCKLCEPKINKLKGGYSATANLIFQSWIKDIRVHVEDRNLTQREAMQLVKDFKLSVPMMRLNFIWGWLWRCNRHLKALFSI